MRDRPDVLKATVDLLMTIALGRTPGRAIARRIPADLESVSVNLVLQRT